MFEVVLAVGQNDHGLFDQKKKKQTLVVLVLPSANTSLKYVERHDSTE